MLSVCLCCLPYCILVVLEFRSELEGVASLSFVTNICTTLVKHTSIVWFLLVKHTSIVWFVLVKHTSIVCFLLVKHTSIVYFLSRIANQ